MSRKAPIKIFAGGATQYLGEKICKSLGVEIGKMNVQHFSDGEFMVSYEESIRGAHVFLIQSTFPTTDNLMELLLMIDAAKRASAKQINAVIPYFGWARQDRKDKPRISIGAKLVADMMGVAGLDRLLTMDLHADQIQGFFDCPVDHLYASTMYLPYIQQLNLENMVVASPDAGGVKRTHAYAKYLEVPMVICHKHRERANEVEEMKIIGDVEGKNVILIDDMVDTAGTITKAADLMMDAGAISVRAFASHGVMSGPAYDRVENSKMHSITFTDSIPRRRESDKVKTLSVADMFAETIQRIYSYQSISSQYLI